MKINLLIILSLLGLFLNSCSSSSVKEEKETKKDIQPAASQVQNKQSLEKVPEKITPSEAVPEPKLAEVISSPYDRLNEAIRLQNDEAIQKSTSEILTQNSKDLKALNALAMMYYKKSKFEAAEYLLAKALAAHPDSSEVYSNRGLVHLAKNERREAVKSFRKAIELNPQDGIAGANLGAIYVQEKDFNKAVLALEIATKNGFRDYKIMSNYAIALSATGKTKDASEIYERVLKDNPSQKDVMLNYAILLIEEMQRYREGLDLLNRLKFVGATAESRPVIKELENKAKAGLQ